MIKRSSELIHLLLSESFRISHQDLVLHFIDGEGHSGLKVLPTYPNVLHAVFGQQVAEHQRFLDDLEKTNK